MQSIFPQLTQLAQIYKSHRLFPSFPLTAGNCLPIQGESEQTRPFQGESPLRSPRPPTTEFPSTGERASKAGLYTEGGRVEAEAGI